MEFIKIGKSIYDYEEYKKEVIRLQNNVLFDIRDLLRHYGFILKLKKRIGYKDLKANFDNEEIGLRIAVILQRNGEDSKQ